MACPCLRSRDEAPLPQVTVLAEGMGRAPACQSQFRTAANRTELDHGVLMAEQVW